MSEQPPIPPHVLAEATAATQASVNQQTKGHVAVVGGGIAGLTAAYRLMQQGFKVTIIESAQDVGGHVTSHEALDANGNPTGLYVDEGGEIVEANSHLEGLCNELGVPLLSREESNGRQLYYVNGKALTAKEIHDGYAPLAEVIEDYRARLKSDDADVRAEAFRELREAGTIDGLLAKHADKVSPEMVTMIKQAYKSEVGRNTDEQDAFNLVTFIGTDPNKFDPYAGSNEGMTFEQGGSSLINALKAKLKEGMERGQVEVMTGTQVSAIDASGKDVQIKANNAQGEIDGKFTNVVMATSLPAMRKIKGIETLGLSEDQMKAVNEMQYTNFTKVIVYVKDEPWKKLQAEDGQQSDGSFITDGTFQACWTCRDTKPVEINGETVHAVTMLVGGDTADMKPAELMAACKKDYAKIYGKSEEEIFVSEEVLKAAMRRWNNPDIACYLAPGDGQFGLVSAMSEQPSNSKVCLAGSYIPIEDQMGFMHCASQSGEKAANRIAEMHMAQLQGIEQDIVSQYRPPQSPAPQKQSGWLSWLGF